jgi:hypothetical protein
MSIPLGQRAVQVSHDAQTQMVLLFSASSFNPSWMQRIILCGAMSIQL